MSELDARGRRLRAASAAVLVLLALAAFGALVWWESRQECARYAYKLESLGGGVTFWNYVCVEWRAVQRAGRTAK